MDRRHSEVLDEKRSIRSGISQSAKAIPGGTGALLFPSNHPLMKEVDGAASESQLATILQLLAAVPFASIAKEEWTGRRWLS